MGEYDPLWEQENTLPADGRSGARSPFQAMHKTPPPVAQTEVSQRKRLDTYRDSMYDPAGFYAGD